MRSNVSELLDKINRLAGSTCLNKLEKDLLKQYLRELYEAIDEVDVKGGKTTLVKQVAEVKNEEVIQPEVVVATESPVVDPENGFNEQVKEESKQPVSDTAIPTQKISINEVIKPGTSLNERVKGVGKEIHAHISTKSMKDMIDLNRRFVFVKELFGGDSEALVKSVSHIDSLKDFETASNYCNQILSNIYNWDKKSQTAKLFYKLVKQKFGEE